MNKESIPNLLTSLRCVLVLPFVIALLYQSYLLAFSLFMLAGLTDFFDGLLARLFQCQSYIGALLDPLADKLLIISAYLLLGLDGVIPFYVVIAVVARDLLILSIALLYRIFVGHIPVAPTMLSKINTTVQLLYVLLCLSVLAFISGYSSIWLENTGVIVFVLTILSGFDYIVRFILWMSRRSRGG